MIINLALQNTPEIKNRCKRLLHIKCDRSLTRFTYVLREVIDEWISLDLEGSNLSDLRSPLLKMTHDTTYLKNEQVDTEGGIM